MQKTIILSTIFISLSLFSVSVFGNVDHWHGSKTVPPHRLTLKTPGGDKIVPTIERGMPFSTSQTCGPCHDYGTVSSGTHFKTSHKKDGRVTEPWIWVDESTGTQLPVTDSLGLSSWKFVKLFGRHMPGGGIGDMTDSIARPGERWNVSGALEVNCLGCHNASGRQDQSEWAKQIARENLMWAGTAASGLGDVSSMAARIKGDWSLYDGPNLDDPLYADPPAVTYRADAFDSKGKAFIDVKSPDDKRCLYCHSTHESGLDRIEESVDVHTAAGLKCVDCHKNELDHKIIRGYETEGQDCKDATVTSASCRGCHMETGRLGAPLPEHKGLPPVHLDKISCTACHAGPAGHGGPVKVQTARANRLGIYGRADWSMDHPGIISPVMAKAEDGKITPHRMMWPAYWGRLQGTEVTPLIPDDIAKMSQGILDAEKYVGDILALMVLDGEQLSSLLGFKEEKTFAAPVFVTGGIIYKRNVDGLLDPVDFSGKIPENGWGYLVEDPEPKYFPLVQDWNQKEKSLGVNIAAEKILIKILDRIRKSPRSLGVPVVEKDGRFFKFATVEYIPVKPDEFANVSAAAEEALKNKEAEMKLRSVVSLIDEKYHRKIGWEYKKEKLNKEPDLKDLEELVYIESLAKADLARYVKFGDNVFTKVIKISEADVAELAKAAQKAQLDLDAAMKKSSVVLENGKYYKTQDGRKERFYIQSKKAKKLLALVEEANKAGKMYASVRKHDDVTYRQVFKGDRFEGDFVLEFKPDPVPAGSFQLGYLHEDKPVKMLPGFMERAIVATESGEALFTEEQVAEFLGKLGTEGGEPVYICSGKMFKLSGAGKLTAVASPAAEPVMWPMAHNVRAASQSLGAKACKECHSVDSPFLFASVSALGPMITDKGAVGQMSDFMGISDSFHKLFGLSFVVRPLFKLAMLGLAGIVSVVLFLYLLLGLRWVTRNIKLPVIEKIVMIAGVLSMIVLFVTGFCTAVCIGRSLCGYSLLIHTMMGALFMACAAVMAVLRSRASMFVETEDGRFSLCSKAAFWLMALLAVGLVSTVLIAMVPVLNTHYQHTAILIHRYLAVLTVPAVVLYLAGKLKR